MKKLILSSILSLFIGLTFAQNNPQVIIEQSTEGYDLAVKMDDVSNLSSIKIEGLLKKNYFEEVLNVDLSVSDVTNQLAFASLGIGNSQAIFTLVLTDSEGLITRYPSIDLNISTDELVSQKF